MTPTDRAEQVTCQFAVAKRQGLAGEELRQRLQDLIEKAIRDGIRDAMGHRVKLESDLKSDAALLRWMNASPAHQAAVRLEMERDQSLSLRAAALQAIGRRKGVAA